MARFSEQDTRAIYEASERFRGECLLKDGSLLFDAESVWTEDHVEHLRRVFVEAPDESGRRFLEKFRDQVQPTGPQVTRLAAEVVAAYFLFPSNVTGDRKRPVVNEILSWSGDSLPASWGFSLAGDRA